MLPSQITLLIEEYSRRNCEGIAAFLELLAKVGSEMRQEIFEEFCVEELAVEAYKVPEPFQFFEELFLDQKNKFIFLDGNLFEIDIACQNYADMLDHSGQRIH